MSSGKAKAFYQLAVDLEVEGVIAKREGSGYVGRRSPSWLKIKRVQNEDFVVGGFTAPQGSRPYFGALIVGLYDRERRLRYVTRVGSGFDDPALASLYAELTRRERPTSPFDPPPAIRDARWVAPELVARVSFSEWTHDGGLRAPVFAGLVPEGVPEECVIPEKEPPLASALESTPELGRPATEATRGRPALLARGASGIGR